MIVEIIDTPPTVIGACPSVNDLRHACKQPSNRRWNMFLVSADSAGSNARRTDRRPDRSTQIYEIHAIRVIAEEIFALNSITPPTNLREVAMNSGPFGFASVQDSAGSVRDSRQTNSVRAEELYFWNLLGDSMISNLRPFASVELDKRFHSQHRSTISSTSGVRSCHVARANGNVVCCISPSPWVTSIDWNRHKALPAIDSHCIEKLYFAGSSSSDLKSFEMPQR